ncbi:MAG: hypothetical protein ACMG57_03910 [Candidatus Dojkabacteria bacterium]
MNNKKLYSITKIFLLILFLSGTFFITRPNTAILLAKTAADNQIYGPVKANSVEPEVKTPDCDGVWINSDITKKIFLNPIYLKDWGAASNPSLILDSLENKNNYLVIGHNICVDGKCDEARSQFANIMNLNVGDKVSACIGGVLSTGYIFTSGPIPDTRTSVMGDWEDFKTVTMFTSYGDCKDSRCSSTQQRWMVAFERDK